MHRHTHTFACADACAHTHINTYTCTSMHLKKKVQEKHTAGILISLSLKAEFHVKGEFLRMSQLTQSDLRKEDGYSVFFLLCCLCVWNWRRMPPWTFSVSGSKTELRTMVQERWASPQVPVLILSCIPTATSLRLPAVDVVEALELSSFSRPWMVSGLRFFAGSVTTTFHFILERSDS